MDIEPEGGDMITEDDIDVNDYIDAAAIENGKCGVCLDIIIDRGVLDCCNDWFCFTCIDNWATITNLCPLCKREFQLITCQPVYDAFGNFMVGRQPCSISRTNDDWIIQDKNNALSFPSYYISEDAVKCLDGTGCKIRCSPPNSTMEEDLILDTSIACDSCDVWYHALCVGFDPMDKPGNSWFCPRCITDEVPQEHGQKLSTSSSVGDSFSSKVSISVADDGETAVVVSMVNDQHLNEAVGNSNLEEGLEISFLGDVETYQCHGANIGESRTITVDKTNVQLLCNSSISLEETKRSTFGKEMSERVEILAEITSEQKAQPSTDVFPEQAEDLSLGSGHILSPTESLDGKDVRSDAPLASSFSVELVTARNSNDDVGFDGGKVTDSVLAVKENVRLAIIEDAKDCSIKRAIDCSTVDQKCKKAKLDGPSDSKLHMNTLEDDSQQHVRREVVFKESRLPKYSGTDNITPEMMCIVEGVKRRPGTVTEKKSSVDEISGRNGAGLRVKKIMHKVGEKAEVADLVHRLTNQIREEISVNPSKQFARDVTLDNKLLTAFRAAIMKPQTEVSNKKNSNLRFNMPVFQRGKVRENLTKKIYKTNGRLRRAWSRDYEIEFYRRKCLIHKPRKVEALQSVLNILKGITSTPGDFRDQLGQQRNSDDSILSRVYLADASVLPRTDGIKSLLDATESSGVSGNDSLQKDPKLVFRTKKIQETTSSTEQVVPNVNAKEEMGSLTHRDKKESVKCLKSGSLASTTVVSGSKESAVPLANEEKKKWALEVLARKNATIDRSKEQENQQDQTLLKGDFPLLAQLPMDMRPVVLPTRHSKFPVSLRQMQLYRFTELYLRRANIPLIRKTAATELAVADAVNIEKEIFERSKSKTVYLNLCSQHVSSLRSQKNERTEVNKPLSPGEVQVVNEHTMNDQSNTSEITEVLKLTGLFSDSPPGNPSQPIQSSDSNDFVRANTVNGDLENVLDMDCNTDIDIYRDFEYDLEDETCCISKNLYTVSSIQSDASKLKVVLSNMDLEKPSPSSEISASVQQLNVNSYDCSISRDAGVPLCDKHEFVVTPHLKIEGSESSSARDLVDEVTYIQSLVECEELYGPEEYLKANPFANELSDAKNFICHDGDDQTLKNEPVIPDSGNAKSSQCRTTGEDDTSPCSLGDGNVYSKQKIATSNQEASKDIISQKVEAYIKEHIRPLCKSGIITTEQYRWAVAKTRDKVMKYHCKAKNANFLVKEGDKVKKLAQQYVEAASKQNIIK